VAELYVIPGLGEAGEGWKIGKIRENREFREIRENSGISGIPGFREFREIRGNSGKFRAGLGYPPFSRNSAKLINGFSGDFRT